MIKTFGILLTLLTAAGCFAVARPEVAIPAPQEKLQEVLNKMDAAGNPEGKTVASVHVRISASVESVNMQIDMEYFADLVRRRLFQKTSARGMPDDISLFDGRNGYSIVSGIQTKAVSGKQLARMRFEAKTADPSLKIPDRYTDLRLDNHQFRIGGRPCFRLVGQPKDEPELPPEELFVDAETFLPVRTATILATDMGEIPCVVDILEYKTINSFPVPVRLETRQLNMVIHAEVKDVQFDVSLPEKTFDKETYEDAEM